MKISTAVLFVIAIGCVTPSFAEEPLTVQQLLDAEAKVTLKRINDELNKPSPGSPVIPVVPVSAITPSKPVYVEPAPVTQYIYGTTGNYRGSVAFGTDAYPAVVGKYVKNYLVTSIDAQGIYLEKTVLPAGKNKKKKHPSATKVVVFAPLPDATTPVSSLP